MYNLAMERIDPPIPSDLILNEKKFPAETVYEVTTQDTGLPFGIAIADIKQSAPHFHRQTIETYTVVQGDLEVSLDKEKQVLHSGDVVRIQPGVVHSARSISEKPARIVVICVPEFSVEDYFLVEDKQ